jgi:hypothetical protein
MTSKLKVSISLIFILLSDNSLEQKCLDKAINNNLNETIYKIFVRNVLLIRLISILSLTLFYDSSILSAQSMDWANKIETISKEDDINLTSIMSDNEDNVFFATSFSSTINGSQENFIPKVKPHAILEDNNFRYDLLKVKKNGDSTF